jgi:transposase-like protein
VPKPYPPEFRRRALDLIASGCTVREVAASLGIAASCLHRWKSLDLIDRGLKAGPTTAESGALGRTRRAPLVSSGWNAHCIPVALATHLTG